MPHTGKKKEKRNRSQTDSIAGKPLAPSTSTLTPLPPKSDSRPAIHASSSKTVLNDRDESFGLSRKDKKRKRKRSLASNADITNIASLAPEKVEKADKEETTPAVLQKYLNLYAPDDPPVSSPVKSSPFFPQKKRSKTSGLPSQHHGKEVVHSPSVKRDDARVDILKKQLASAREEATKQQEDLLKRIKELEDTVEAKKGDIEAQDKTVEEHNKVRDQLKDAVTCQVCFETLNDPHILSCGHHACKTCLMSWFRTPGAYVHDVPADDIAIMNLSYRTKVCHVCRSYVIHRPVRMYHLMSILEPLGLDFHLPTTSQANEEREEFHDPWRNIFPPEKDYYHIKDPSDGVNRCPECIEEIDMGICTGCGIEFSDAGEDWENEDDFDMDGSGEDMGLDVGGNDSGDSSDGSVVALDGARQALFGFDRPNRPAGAFRRAAAQAEGDADGPERHRGTRSPPVQPRGRRMPAGLAGVLDLMAEDDDAVGETGDYPYDSDMEELSDEEGYEDSFIDDGDESEVEAEGAAGSAQEAGEDESDASGELSIAELRRRRNVRYAASPEVVIRRAPTRQRGRQVISSGSE